MICKNCGHDFEGSFCNKCGQSSSVQRIGFKYLIDEVSNSVFQVNRGLFFTIKELFTRPGHSIREFLEGKRKYHFRPLAFILLISTIYVITTHIIGRNTFFGDFLTGISESLSNDKVENVTVINILNWFANNHAFSTLLLLPFFSLASYLSFIKAKYNYFEHLFINIYIAGQKMIIYLIFSIFIFITKENDYLEIIPLGLGILFTFWAYIQIFNSKSYLTKIALIILTYIFYFLQIAFIIILVLSTYVFIEHYVF